MINLYAKGPNIVFKKIEDKQLSTVLSWYNDTEEFKYATGIDEKLTMKDLVSKYKQSSNNEKKFFIGIFHNKTNHFLGIIKGSLLKEKKQVVWLNSIIVDKKHQRNGYGKESINLLGDYFGRRQGIQEFYISVAENNKSGKKFWEKVGFDYIKTLENHLSINNSLESIYVMKRNFTKRNLFDKIKIDV